MILNKNSHKNKNKPHLSLPQKGVKNKFYYYEKSVQSPDLHVEFFDKIYGQIFGGFPKNLREDFGGTFALSAQWVKSDTTKKAWVYDLDSECLDYGKRKHYSRLSGSQKKRISIHQEDVLNSKNQQKFDIIAACNFSFNIFKTRKSLKKYFDVSKKRLQKKGALLLEMAGGPGMIQQVKERCNFYKPGTKQKEFVYIWHQKKFDPIDHSALYSISFEVGDKSKGPITLLKDAFVYDWRLWTIPEIKDLLVECGYSEVFVFWEMTHKGEGTGEYVMAQSGDNAHAWIAYVVARK